MNMPDLEEPLSVHSRGVINRTQMITTTAISIVLAAAAATVSYYYPQEAGTI